LENKLDDQTEKKIRDLKLRILKTEKELQSSQHHLKLGAWLRAGHAGQLNRNAEKDRIRLEEKLKDLHASLESLTGVPSTPPPAPKAFVAEQVKAPAPQPAEAPKAEKKSAKTEKPAVVKTDKPLKKTTAKVEVVDKKKTKEKPAPQIAEKSPAKKEKTPAKKAVTKKATADKKTKTKKK
jgi:outer membrane biosynthesis protein TonB